MADKFLKTKAEIAEMLSISVKTLDRILKTENVPFLMVGKQKRFDVLDTMSYFAFRTFDKKKGENNK